MKQTISLVALLLVSACTTPAATESSTPATVAVATTTTPPTTTLEVASGAVEVFTSPSYQDAPVVIFFHGGSWYTGDPDNVAGFAAELSEAGIVVYNATYRTGQQAGGFPQSYEDIACAIAQAQATAADSGGDPSRVFVAGHSAGAHLAATTIFAGDRFTETCSFDPVAGFIGLAGPYATNDLAPLLEGWFGGSIADIPETFDAGQPYTYIETATPIPSLLIHGTADELVPVAFTTDLTDALAAAAWSPTLEILDQVTHGGIIAEDADLTISLIADFVNQ